MTAVRIKICGLTRPEDARAAADAGADAVGLVFFSGSRRCVSAAQARKIVAVLPPFVSVTALFVNAAEAEINRILSEVPIDLLQFHGDETADFCRRFARPYLKAVRVRDRSDIVTAADAYPDARALLFDAHVDGAYGGTGQAFDWEMLPHTLHRPWILSGGLHPENVTHAIRQTGAVAVDVSSGVESAAGIKCADKMAAFVAACRAK